MATDDTRKSTSDAYEVISASPTTPKVLSLDGKDMAFRQNGMMRIKDRGLAMAVRDKYGQGKAPGVTVTKVNAPATPDRGHRYFFGGWPEMPWKRRKENA